MRGLKEHVVIGPEAVLALLEQGEKNRYDDDITAAVIPPLLVVRGPVPCASPAIGWCSLGMSRRRT